MADSPLSTILTHLPLSAYRCRPDGAIEWLSDGAQLLGNPREGDPPPPPPGTLSDLARPEERAGLARSRSEALARGRAFELTYRLCAASGERWVREHGAGVPSEDGQPMAMVGLIRDVTEELRAERALTASEDRYKGLLASVSDYICTVKVRDGSAVETIHGPGCVAVTGYTSEEYRADPFLWYRMVHEDDREAVQRHAERAQSGATTSIEHRIRHRDGRVTWVSNTPVPRFDERGVLVAYDALIADITARKEAEAALVANERFLEGVFASIQDGISILDREFRILRVNLAMERWYAHALPLIGRRCFEAYHGRSERCEVCPSARCLVSGRAEHDTVPWIGAGGEVVGWLDLFSFPLTDPATGELRGVIEYVRDVTETRRAQQALLETEEQLRQAHKMEAVGTLAGGVAHDFNNLLTAILGYADLLRRDLEEQEGPGARRIEEIIRAGNRAAALTRKLLAFSRKQVLAPRPLDLSAVLIDMGDMLRRLIAEDIELIIIADPGLASLRADPAQLEQVILNLVVNARDAMPQGGRLTIETRNATLDASYAAHHVGVRPGAYVLLSVSDTGCGMDAETRSHLFEPFFTTKGPGQGTGLGLATVYGIVKQSGGNVWVYSEVGQGTTVKVYLPQDRVPVGDQELGEDMEVIAGGSETVIVVEDEEAIRSLARDILRGCGYTVLSAANGREAETILSEFPGPIHLLLTDVVMPRMSGHELAELAVRLRPEIAILYMSGYTDEAVVLHGVETRKSVFLQKPFTAQELTRKAREAIETREQRRGAEGDQA